MRVTKLSEVPSLNVGDQLEFVRGTVHKIFKRTENEYKGQPRSFQTFLIKDGKHTVKVMLRNREALKNCIGRVIEFTALNSDRGLSGIKIEEDEYKGETENAIVITPSAEMAFADDDDPPEERRGNGTRRAPDEDPAQGKAKPAAKQETQEELLLRLKRSAMRMANGMLIACNAALVAKKMFDQSHPEDEPISESHFHGMSTTIFISLCDYGVESLSQSPLVKLKAEEDDDGGGAEDPREGEPLPRDTSWEEQERKNREAEEAEARKRQELADDDIPF
jgi:hypothetical protein